MGDVKGYEYGFVDAIPFTILAGEDFMEEASYFFDCVWLRGHGDIT